MSLSIVSSCVIQGSVLQPVQVEAHLGSGLPGLQLVGLAGGALRDARERVRAAIQSSGFKFPARRTVVSLTPADLPKDAAHFDLPIALALLAASGQIPQQGLAGRAWLGSLSLSGRCLPLAQPIPMALLARLGRCPSDPDLQALVLPACHLDELSAWPRLADTGLQLLGVESLQQACLSLQRGLLLAEVEGFTAVGPSLSDSRAQAVEGGLLSLAGCLAAAGGHSLLYIGAPESFRVFLQQSHGLLPPLAPAALLEVNLARHLAKGPAPTPLWVERPQLVQANRLGAGDVGLLAGGGGLVVEGRRSASGSGSGRADLLAWLLGGRTQPGEVGPTLWCQQSACSCGLAPAVGCICSRQQRRQQWSRLPPAHRGAFDLVCLGEASSEALPSDPPLPPPARWPDQVAALRERRQRDPLAATAICPEGQALVARWADRRSAGGLPPLRLAAVTRVARTLALFRSADAESTSRVDLLLARGLQTGWPFLDELDDASSRPGWWSASAPRPSSRPSGPPPPASPAAPGPR